MTELRKLPIGIENFEEIRQEDFYYVDKTQLIEVKYASDGNMEKECENALQQITDIRYTEDLEQEGIHKIIKYGIACYKKKCKVMMKIEE